jgi:hypothetical protein
VYEIAKVKSRDHVANGLEMQEICKQVCSFMEHSLAKLLSLQIIASCHCIGVEVVKSIDDVDEHRRFQEARKEYVANILKAIEEQKAAKMLRTAT